MAESIRGSAAIKAMQAEAKAKAEAANRPKAEWFKWPKNVNVATVRFLQELDPSAENYREDRGIGFIQVEHQAPGPDGFKRRGNCTLESEGQCYPDERHAMRIEADKGGWRQRQNLYINALVQYEGETEPKVLVISRNANSSFVQALIEEAVDEGSITNANYKVTKTGEGTSTQWLLKRLKGEPFDDSNVEVFDLDETAVRAIPYDKQAEYYGAVYSVEGAEPVSAGVGASSSDATGTDVDW